MIQVEFSGKFVTFEQEAIKQIVTDLNLISLGNGNYHLLKDQKSHSISILNYFPEEKKLELSINGKIVNTQIKDATDILLNKLGLSANTEKKIKNIKAPMPGLIIDIAVSEGTEVQEGDKLITLEAMKMENSIKSPVSGTIKSVKVTKGIAVEKNQLLVEFV